MKKNNPKTALYTGLLTVLISCVTYAQPPQGQEGDKPKTIEELFNQLDIDKDNEISKKEAKGPLKEDFDKIDLNKDAFLTKEEVEKAPKPKRKKG
jgi:Ca2+-binding EF-hand superfamily protein